MKLLNKIANAKTNTVVVLTLLLPVLGLFTPWVSFRLVDFISRGLYAAIFSNVFDRYFETLANIYGILESFNIQIAFALIAVLLLIIISLSFYLLRVLYKRHQAGTAHSLQFLSPAAFVGFFIALLVVGMLDSI